MRYLFFPEHVCVVMHIDIDALAGHNAAFTKGVLLWMPQSHKLVVSLEIGKLQVDEVADRFQCSVPCPDKLREQRFQFAGCRCPVEATDFYIDGMYLPAADGAQDRIPDLFHPQSAPHQFGMLLSHGDRVGITQEIGRMQHEHVQAVT